MFGTELVDAALLPALVIALLGGVLSFLSPCVLPIVPPYLAYMAGTTIDEVRARDGTDWRVVSAAAFFVLGLSTVFIFLGFAASAFGRMLLQYQDIMTRVAGAVIVIFGLHFIGLFRIPLLDREARVDAGDQSGKIFGAYVLGLAFAFGWTPCLGPILAAILSMVAQESSTGRGVALMAVYAFGLGLPFLLTAFFLGRSMAVMSRLKRHMGLIEKSMGGLLILVGVMMFTGAFSAFAFWLLETFPVLGAIG